MIKNKTEFNLHLERLKKKNQFETYLETISHYLNHESDLEPEQVAKKLNSKIVQELAREGVKTNMIRGITKKKVTLF